MSSDHTINFQSLGVVRDELIATIEDAARDLENFVNSKQEDAESLQSSINGVRQITGILRVLELDSAALLAEELLKVSNEIPQGAEGPAFNRKIEVMSNTFFILTRYLEYLQQVKHQVPALLIPHINALRKLNEEDALSESHFINIKVPSGLRLPEIEKSRIEPANLRSEIRRARHMFQIGLTGVIRERNVSNSMALMRRGVKRMLKLCGSTAKIAPLWWLADVTLAALSNVGMNPLATRKFLFMRIDSLFRCAEQDSQKAFGSSPSECLIKELLYLIALSGDQTDSIKSVMHQCNDLALPYTEQQLQKQIALLYGPSAHTISTLSQVLDTEISSAKRVLENAAQSSNAKIDDLDSFTSVLVNIAEILNVVGLGAASQSLKEQVNTVKSWSTSSNAMSTKSMTDVANNLLYLESLIKDLQNADFNAGKDGATNKGQRDARIASHEFSSAFQVVISESLGGLSLSKRALNAFSDSNYDTGHIRNIGRTLNSIRGAMSLLKKPRVAATLEKSANFVDEVLLGQDAPDAISEVLEIFADVIVAIEYYFDSANSLGEMDDSVLQVAEESLAALGYDD